MGKNKLARFAENETFNNLFQHTDYDLRSGEIFPNKGHWNKDYFKNDNPIVLELGCGKGEYTLGLADRFPNKNFIGIDRKGARLWRGCKDANLKEQPNVGFIRTKIEDLHYFFGEEEVSEIWITFPDPQPKKPRKRLVSPHFIDIYRPILKKGSIIHLKTDSRLLYEFLMETIVSEKWELIEQQENVYDFCENPILTEIQTFYEKKWIEENSLISHIAFRVK
ncbi:MAG: tRNA (guanosine(46)-N7)-methyltransferase TrmB [Bacteroidales bacterium]|nr:tRNA (guanosine(46)-N7)-methyltransferase TrmB [Bacteroidales bacterium]